MLESITTVFTAAVSGSLEIFLLCLTGAYLFYREIFDRAVCRSLSRAIVNAFLPALLFLSIVRTLHSLKQEENATLIILTPVFLSLFTQTLGIVLGLTIVRYFGADLEPMVRRALVLCVGFGNSNTLPILVMRALCDTFEPLSDDAGSIKLCKERSTGFCSLFLIVWSIAFWSIGLRYLIGANPEDQQELELPGCEANPEEESMLPMDSRNDDETTFSKPDGQPSSTKIPGLLTSPVLAIFFALVIGHMPRLSKFFVTTEGPTQSVRLTLQLLGTIVIPLSPIIIGSKLYSRAIDSPEHSVGTRVIIAVLVGRLILMPAIGLLLFLLFRSYLPSDDPLLHLVLLCEMSTPSANNNIIMAQIASIFRPRAGKAVESTVATLIFWQYVVLPIVLSANIAMFLATVFGSTTDTGATSV